MNSNKDKHRALMVGCGKMGGALLQQWVKSGEIDFTVIDPAAQNLPNDVISCTDISQLPAQQFDIIIVAIKPQLIDTVLPSYAKHLVQDGTILSIAAGCSAQRLSEALGTDAIIRVMPNLPAFIGQGVAGLYASEAVHPKYRKLAESLMNLAGRCIWVETEDGIDRITAVAGSGPGYVFEFARSYVQAAMSLGFSETQARDLVLGTIAGTIEMAQQSSETLETLRNNVTSKNGTTEAGLNALNADGVLTEKLQTTVDAAYKRAVELR